MAARRAMACDASWCVPRHLAFATRRMTFRADVAMDNRYTPPSRDGDIDSGQASERRGPGRPLGDSRLPAHIMAAVRDTIRSAAATCVDASRLESSGPYEWLAIV